MVASTVTDSAEAVEVQHLAVLGSPIGHSKSPRIHRAAFGERALAWEYTALECGERELEGFLNGLDETWRGLSLTMPLKEEAHRIAKVLDPVAEESGVVNTLLRLANDASGHPQWAGFNTDVAGLAAAVSRAGLDATHTVILGAGATAVSALLAARALGAESVTVVARRGEAAAALAERFSGTFASTLSAPEIGHTPTLIISTLPGTAGGSVEIARELCAAPLFDVAYDPWPSPLAERWRAAGRAAHSGLAMLIEQALLQQRIFVNGDPNIVLTDEERLRAVMRDAVGGADMGGW